MCWWKISYYDLLCLWLCIATRVGSLRTDWWNHCVLCWDALRLGQLITIRSQTACLNGRDSWCHPCSSMTGVTTGMSSCLMSCMRMERVSMNQSGTLHFVSWWGRVFPTTWCFYCRTQREHDTSPHPFATWVRDALEVAYDHLRESLHRTAALRKRLYGIKEVNKKFPVGLWVLRYYPPPPLRQLNTNWDLHGLDLIRSFDRPHGRHPEGPGKTMSEPPGRLMEPWRFYS